MDGQALRASLERVVEAAYTDGACVCRFPRIVRVLGFDFRPHAPMMCVETEFLMGLVFRRPGAWEVLSNDGGPHEHAGRRQCTRCGSLVQTGWEEFSIHLQCQRASWLSMPEPLGAPHVPPAPLYGGLRGYERDPLAFRALWRRADTIQEVEAWLLAPREPASGPRPLS